MGREVTITILQPVTIKYKKESYLAKIVTIFLTKAILPPVPRRSKRLSRKVIGKVTGFTGTWVTKLEQRFEDYGVQGLDRLPKGSLLPKKVERRLLSLLAQDIFLTPKELTEKLVEEGYEASPQAVKNVLRTIDLNSLLPSFRSQVSGKANSEEKDYIIEQLFGLITEMLPHTNLKSVHVKISEIKERYQRYSKGSRPAYQWDQEQRRESTETVRSQKEYWLRCHLEGQIPKPRCPHCGNLEVHIKEHRQRKYQDLTGSTKVGQVTRYDCCNSLCGKSFSVGPSNLQPYSRTEQKLQAYALNEAAKGVSLSKIDLKGIICQARVHKTTILRWIKRVTDTMPRWSVIFGLLTSGTVAIDEKWVKVRKKWHYVFIAIDVATLDLIHIEIFPQRDNNSAKVFLTQMKSMGFEFDIIATDCCPIYDQAIADMFPGAKHVHCILHMGRSMRNRLMKVFGSYSNNTYKELAPLLSAIYQAKEEDTFEKAWAEWSKTASAYPQLEKFNGKLKEDKDSIKARVLDKDAPRTTNSVERVILEFERKYSQMQSFISLPSARAWCRLFQNYYRLRPFERGRFAGMSPAEAMGYPVKGLQWTDYLLPREELYCNADKPGKDNKSQTA